MGRSLKENEVVHHIDHNRTNNLYDNLLIFHSAEDHASFHHNEDWSRLEQLNDGSYICKDKRELTTTCPICGMSKGLTSKMCNRCFSITHGHARSVIKEITREELKNLIRHYPFT